MRKRLLKIDLLGVSCRSVSEDLIGCLLSFMLDVLANW